jgi:rare lipoprotein A (peptidoglycan hydrolase)
MKLRSLACAALLAVGCSSPNVVTEIQKTPTPAPKVTATPKKKRSIPTSSPTPPKPKKRIHHHMSNLVQMSWYGYGTGTASGEALDVNAQKCAAIDSIPMHSRWALRNPENGRTTTITVNDRGAFESMGRTFDCVPAVVRVLGFELSQGVYQVEATSA